MTSAVSIVEIISHMVLAMTSCGRGFGEIQNLKIFVKKE
jgi:hypothetical protein